MEREERLDVLEARMKVIRVSAEKLWWYLDTQKFGAVPHAGFGLGLELFGQHVARKEDIVKVIPRTSNARSAEI